MLMVGGDGRGDSSNTNVSVKSKTTIVEGEVDLVNKDKKQKNPLA